MSTERAEAVWLDAHCEVSFAELARLSGLTGAELRELVEYGALVPNNPRESQWTFSGECVVTVRTAQRLRESFDLDPNALSLALGFLERIRVLEAELRALRAQLPHRAP
jgi:chaperone modulatory protein CbpM